MEQYPITENEQERKLIDRFVSKIPEYVKRARRTHLPMMSELGRRTRMIAGTRRYKNFFVPFHLDRTTFGILQEHHYRKVLLVAFRRRWLPAEILALWQNEGLPAHYLHEGETPGTLLRISDWFRRREPEGSAQARAWAISIVLWERWGLDRLIPHSEGKDNPPSGLKVEDHERIFQESFARECVPYLSESPWTYLSAEDGPIKVKSNGGIWYFRTHPEYQSTVLMLQMARFQKQIRRIPPGYKDLSAPVYTRPVFPAALYFHYNSPRAEEHFKLLARSMIKAFKRTDSELSAFNGDDLYRFYTGSPIPKKEVEDVVIDHAIRTEKERGKPYFNKHPWVNGLRFELLRRIYSELFADVTIEEPVSPFLIQEI